MLPLFFLSCINSCWTWPCHWGRSTVDNLQCSVQLIHYPLRGPHPRFNPTVSHKCHSFANCSCHFHSSPAQIVADLDYCVRQFLLINSTSSCSLCSPPLNYGVPFRWYTYEYKGGGGRWMNYSSRFQCKGYIELTASILAENGSELG